MSNQQQPVDDQKRIGDVLRSVAGDLANLSDDWGDEDDSELAALSIAFGVVKLRQIADNVEAALYGKPLPHPGADDDDGPED